MSDNIIKFGKAKKALARKIKEKQAAENRVKFGRRKTDKVLGKHLEQKEKSKLDGHKLSPDKSDD